MWMGRQIFRPALMAGVFSIPLLAVGFVLLVPVIGMGHGWTGPVPVMFAACMLFPLAIARFRLDPVGAPWWQGVGISAVIISFAVAVSVTAFAVSFVGPGAMPIGGFTLLGPLIVLGCVVVSLGVHVWMRDAVRGAIWGDVQLIGMALWTDWVLYLDARSGASFGFRGNVFEYIWLGFWCMWQGILVAALIRHIAILRRRV
jgi:hypothetical protein